MNFFHELSADKLGNTKIINAAAQLGQRGPLFKMLDISVPDDRAAALLISCRSEYSTNQAMVSQTIGPPIFLVGATNAAPIVVSTVSPHGYITGQAVTIQGVRGNTAANGSWAIIVTGATTFSLTGSDGTVTPTNFPYLAGGTCVPISGGGTGSGADQIGSPLVGILQWGVGGGHNELEFDIPAPRLAAALTPLLIPQNQPMTNVGSGINVPISASHVSFWVRNDGNLSPVNNIALNNWVGSPTPAKVIVFVGPDGGGGQAKVTRTIYAVGGNNLVSPDQLAVNGHVLISVPPFAKRVRIQAGGMTLVVGFLNNFGLQYRVFSIPTGWEDWIEFDPQTATLDISNTSATPVFFMQCVFDVSPI